jgi:hypothetical protein
MQATYQSAKSLLESAVRGRRSSRRQISSVSASPLRTEARAVSSAASGVTQPWRKNEIGDREGGEAVQLALRTAAGEEHAADDDARWL